MRGIRPSKDDPGLTERWAIFHSTAVCLLLGKADSAGEATVPCCLASGRSLFRKAQVSLGVRTLRAHSVRVCAVTTAMRRSPTCDDMRTFHDEGYTPVLFLPFYS